MAIPSEFTQLCMRVGVEGLEIYLRDGNIPREHLLLGEFCHYTQCEPTFTHYQKCALLLNAGADANQRAILDRTPLMIVCSFPNKHSTLLCDLLLAYGADINATDKYNGAALHVVAGQSSELSAHLVRHLLQKGADPNVCGNFCIISPLHAAATSLYPNRVEICRNLLEYGANPNQRNWCGDTCLHQMLHQVENIRHGAIEELLLDFGADPTIRNSAGELPPNLVPILTRRRLRHDKLKSLMMIGRCQFASPLHIIDEATIEIITQHVHKIP